MKDINVMHCYFIIFQKPDTLPQILGEFHNTYMCMRYFSHTNNETSICKYIF